MKVNNDMRYTCAAISTAQITAGVWYEPSASFSDDYGSSAFSLVILLLLPVILILPVILLAGTRRLKT